MLFSCSLRNKESALPKVPFRYEWCTAQQESRGRQRAPWDKNLSPKAKSFPMKRKRETAEVPQAEPAEESLG